MTLKADITADNAVFLNTSEFAQTVTYNGTEIQALVDLGDDDKKNPDAAHATLTVSREDVDDPDYRDEVVIDGVTWRVFRDRRQNTVIIGDHAQWELPLMRAERMPIP